MCRWRSLVSVHLYLHNFLLKSFFALWKIQISHVYLSFGHHNLFFYCCFVPQREHKLKQTERDNKTGSSHEKPVRVASLKKKVSECPALSPRPSLTNPVLRRNSSGRKVDNFSVPSRVSVRSSILRRNSRDKTDSLVVSCVASGLRRNSSSCSDTTTSPDKTSTSVPESANTSSETSTSLYRPHYLRTAQDLKSEDEGDTRKQAESASHPPKDVIPKPRTFPRRERASIPDTEMRGPPKSIPPDPPYEFSTVILSSNNQSSEEKNLPPSTPPEDPKSSPTSFLSETDTLEEDDSSKYPTTKVNTCQLLFYSYSIIWSIICLLL